MLSTPFRLAEALSSTQRTRATGSLYGSSTTVQECRPRFAAESSIPSSRRSRSERERVSDSTSAVASWFAMAARSRCNASPDALSFASRYLRTRHSVNNPKQNRMRESAAELSPAQFREAGHRLVDQIADFLSTIADKPVAPSASPHELRELIGGGGVPETGMEPGAILDHATQLMFANSTFNGHPRFFGYIT